jgi:hypothetical protein
MSDLTGLTHEELVRVVRQRATGTPPRPAGTSTYLRAADRPAIHIQPYKKRRRAPRVLLPAVPSAIPTEAGTDEVTYADFFTGIGVLATSQLAQFA